MKLAYIANAFKSNIMNTDKVLNYIKDVLEHMPKDWLHLTTHRLDIYDEQMAKTQFLDQFETLYSAHNHEQSALNQLPTAYDYIRLGHPLSCILEWGIAQLNQIKPECVISFASQTMPILSILRHNALHNKNTLIAFTGTLDTSFDTDTIKGIYDYHFDMINVESPSDIPAFDGSVVYIADHSKRRKIHLNQPIDFFINRYPQAGSILLINGTQNGHYVSEIQHVRRRETIAMTPEHCLALLKSLAHKTPYNFTESPLKADKTAVLDAIKSITGTTTKALVGSSGLSIQYAIMMGLIHDAKEHHQGKPIKIIVPPNCYGGTNDQARRVAATLNNVDVVDLPVDGEFDMVEGIDIILNEMAQLDAVPFIITEIPTNPRVEVPNLQELKAALSKVRETTSGEIAIAPVFILDQTFCPNVRFLGEGDILSKIRAISYASGSKFPSGGQCTAGYCVGNSRTTDLLLKIETHLALCDNEATTLQYNILAKQLPTMLQRIDDAYTNTRLFVNFISEILPSAKINFVSEELARQGFTPSVFSLDLPTKGSTEEDRETYKRALNLKLINLMISELPNESKFCVSYGQLKGCYWTIPATSTQGTTKEDDKDYIIRASLSPNLDLERHKEVFSKFIKEHINTSVN